MSTNGGLLTIQGYLEPAGYVQITDISTAGGVGLGTIPAGIKLVMIQAEAQNIRWTDDGTAPTSAVGMILVANDILVYSGPMSAFKMIQAAGGGIANLSFYK